MSLQGPYGEIDQLLKKRWLALTIFAGIAGGLLFIYFAVWLIILYGFAICCNE